MSIRPGLFFLCVCSLVGLAAAVPVGFTFSDRLSSHEGFYQVTVEDPLARSAKEVPMKERLLSGRPRRTVVVVVDGLGYREALHMRSLAQLAAVGQCRKTYVGNPSMSRPVYAVISTGLEQDRTGVRNNDDMAPLAAQSIWDLARQASLSVSAVSELPWWQQLFPRGFSTYLMPERSADYFRLAPPADLMLIHPIYLDETGHSFGAASAQYKDDVVRADRELSGLLATLDLTQDLILVTADHGHSLRGGHGGPQDRVANVLTCYAGRGVKRLGRAESMRTTSIGPSLALLLRLPFPAQLRAGAGPAEDGLDVLWQIAEPAAFPAGYLQERQAVVERFRAQNRSQLLAWLPQSGGSWSAFYDWHRQKQQTVAFLFVLTGMSVVALVLRELRRRTRPAGEAGQRRDPSIWVGLGSLSWMALVYVAVYALQVLLRGSFDMTSIASRTEFIHFTVALSALCCIGAVLLHLLLRRCLLTLLIDLGGLLCVTAVAELAHPVALGWKLGFPVPGSEWIFFPYFVTLFLLCLSGVSLLVSGLVWGLYGRSR